MKKMKITAIIVFMLFLAGCMHYGQYEIQGVSTIDIKERINKAYDDMKVSRRSPPNCSVILETTYNGRLDMPWGMRESVKEAWNACLIELEALERKAKVQREQYLAEEAAWAKKKKERRQREFEKSGPDFVDLYILAQTKGIKAANERLNKYGKSSISSFLEIKECNGNICIAGFPNVSIGRGKTMLNILTRGIRAEPGQGLSNFKLVRFDQYGYGSQAAPIAVFTYK